MIFNAHGARKGKKQANLAQFSRLQQQLTVFDLLIIGNPLTRFTGDQVMQTKIENNFKLFDRDHDDFINLSELKELLISINQVITRGRSAREKEDGVKGEEHARNRGLWSLNKRK